jgi:hypothetical protein
MSCTNERPGRQMDALTDPKTGSRTNLRELGGGFG